MLTDPENIIFFIPFLYLSFYGIAYFIIRRFFR